jgi:hypothetical protein
MADNTEAELLDNPTNNKLENLAEEITTTADKETINSTQETDNMEVHHHPDLHHKPKKWKEYFLEFLMIFLAVTMGFLAESLREHLSDNKREQEYIHSLIGDLQQDTSNINFVTKMLFKNIRGQDSLINLLQNYQDNDSLNRKCYYYYISATCNEPLMSFSEGTITQLLNTGNMRLITKSGIADSIMNYNSLIKGIALQGQSYSEVFKKTLDYSANIFDFTLVRNPLQENFQVKQLNNFNTTTFKLVSNDKVTIQKYLSNVVMQQIVIATYISDLKLASDYEKKLIALLKRKYRQE